MSNATFLFTSMLILENLTETALFKQVHSQRAAVICSTAQ